MYINKNFTIFLLKSFKALNLVKHSKQVSQLLYE